MRFGTNRSGTQRRRCKACRKSFTPAPQTRSLTEEKEEQITAALRERLSQRAIARTFRISRNTIRTIRRTLRKSR